MLLDILLYGLAYLGVCFIIFILSIVCWPSVFGKSDKFVDYEMLSIIIVCSMLPLVNLMVLAVGLKETLPRLRIYFYLEDKDK